MTAAEKERKRIVRLVEKLTIPLSGWDRFPDRAEFAAFNMGRYQQAVIMAIIGHKPRLPRTEAE